MWSLSLLSGLGFRVCGRCHCSQGQGLGFVVVVTERALPLLPGLRFRVLRLADGRGRGGPLDGRHGADGAADQGADQGGARLGVRCLRRVVCAARRDGSCGVHCGGYFFVIALCSS